MVRAFSRCHFGADMPAFARGGSRLLRNTLLRWLRAPFVLPSKDLPTGLRNEERNENLLVHRVQGILHSDAGLPSMRRLLPAAATLREAEMREKVGQEGISSECSGL
jgi:hypothetical protein